MTERDEPYKVEMIKEHPDTDELSPSISRVISLSFVRDHI